MAVTGKLVVLIVFVIGVIFQSPQMILRPGLLGALFSNFTETALKFTGRTGVHKHKSFLRGDTNTLSVMEPVAEVLNVKYLSQNEAINFDLELFHEYKFSLEQLMELAGLSVATAVANAYPAKKSEKVLIIAGTGNNGGDLQMHKASQLLPIQIIGIGDGLVAARHLKLFGFQNVSVLLNRKPIKEFFLNLIHQAESNDVDVSYDWEPYRQDQSLGLVIDALFGFSFKPPVRPDFQPLMNILVSSSTRSIPVVAVDIPSGWDVEKGPPSDNSIHFMPDMLVSLSAPKICATHFKGTYHFLGGRFVPRALADKYVLNLPPYPGTDCVMRLK